MEGSVNALQSRLDVVGAAMSEITVAHDTLKGLKQLQSGDPILVPVGAGSYVRMTVADSKNLIMGIGAGAAMEKNVESSVEELKAGFKISTKQERNSTATPTNFGSLPAGP